MACSGVSDDNQDFTHNAFVKMRFLKPRSLEVYLFCENGNNIRFFVEKFKKFSSNFHEFVTEKLLIQLNLEKYRFHQITINHRIFSSNFKMNFCQILKMSQNLDHIQIVTFHAKISFLKFETFHNQLQF